jgi:hypothetical protein
MDDDALAGSPRTAAAALLAVAMAAVAALTLVPQGSGWAWGSPPVELRWYLTGLYSASTMVQLMGNLSLLVVPAALAVLLWPGLGRRLRLVGLSAAAGATIELLQWVLPLGRVVSPLDAALNAVGAVTAGSLVAHLRRARRPIPGRVAG